MLGFETVRVTDTVRGLFDAAGAVMVKVPLYVPAVRPVILTETLTLPGAVPLAGVTDSQVPPDVVAVKANPVMSLPIETLRADGAVPPIV
jgi:hypothetical protein